VTIALRRARVCDAPALAELIEIAGQAHYPESGYALSLGGSRESRLRELAQLAVMHAPSWFHYSHFDVAEVDGRIVAGAAGFDKIPADEALPAALREIGWTDERIAALDEWLADLYAAFPPEQSGYWTVEHVAVLPGWRGRGLSRRVLECVLRRGRELGFPQAKLDVFRDNTAAIALYERLGFTVSAVFAEEPLRCLLGRDALLRMTRSLGGSDL
jgi:ribosomal protein S18 acetylase RimI-like enzyme